MYNKIDTYLPPWCKKLSTTEKVDRFNEAVEFIYDNYTVEKEVNDTYFDLERKKIEYLYCNEICEVYTTGELIQYEIVEKNINGYNCSKSIVFEKPIPKGDKISIVYKEKPPKRKAVTDLEYIYIDDSMVKNLKDYFVRRANPYIIYKLKNQKGEQQKDGKN